MLVLNTKEDCIESANDQVDRAMGKDQWAVIVISAENGVVTLEETTYQFPTSEHRNALRLIAAAFNQKDAIPVVEELPLAKHLQQDGGIDENPPLD